jgi:NAD(P)H-hydrate epimerase
MIRRRSQQDLTLSCPQLRELDRLAVTDWGMSSLVLMENAGRGAADLLDLLGAKGPIVICCGKGNNGGDGLVLARHLGIRGRAVEIFCWNDPPEWTGDAAVNYRILAHAGIHVQDAREWDSKRLASQLEKANWLVDGLLGTGLSGDPRRPMADAIRAMNACGHARRMALDIPSGLDGDSGRPGNPTIRADVTCTFAASKKGFDDPAARDYLGEIWLADIGVPTALVHRVATS